MKAFIPLPLAVVERGPYVDSMRKRRDDWVYRLALDNLLEPMLATYYAERAIDRALDHAQKHFDGCPMPVGQPFDCSYCQERSRSMAGVG